VVKASLNNPTFNQSITYKFVQNVAVFGAYPPLEVVFENEEKL
jgi:hypothetical protein